MTDYHSRVDEAISSGCLWRAKEILQGRLATSGYDRELFLRYAMVLKQMGDLRVAGRYFFLSAERAPEYEDEIKLFLDRDRNGPFSVFWSAMPAAVRTAEMASIPDTVLNELTELGFNKAEINAEFRKIKKKIQAKRDAADSSPANKTDWGGLLALLVFGLLAIGLAYQAITGLIAVGRLVVSWLPF